MFNVTVREFFGIAAGIVSLLAFLPYVFDILKGNTKPSGASWWTWTLLTAVTVLSSWFAGAPWQVLILPTWLCFSQFGVAILSLKYGDSTWDRLNKICIGGACVGILLWILTGQPLIALFISILADFLASVPNFRHAFLHPEQESLNGWALGWLSAVLEIFAISAWSLAESGWAVYFLINMSITLFLVSRPFLAKSKFKRRNY